MKNCAQGRATSRRFLRPALGLLLAILPALVALARVESRTDRPPSEDIVPLFTSWGEEEPVLADIAPQVVRTRPVTINPVFFHGDGIRTGMKILISAFPQESFLAVLQETAVDINGVRSFRGMIEGTEGGAFLLSSMDGCALGVLDIPEWSTRIEIAPVMERGLHVVRDVERIAGQHAELDDGPPLLPPAEGPAAADLPGGATAAADTEVNVDLMVVYTPAASSYASGIGGINLVISQAMQLSQLSLDNSNAGIRLRLVFSGQVVYQESGSSSTDLNRLTSISDGYMDEVHAWRNVHGADMVNLLADVDDVGGLAWLLNASTGRPTYAFSLVRIRQASSGYTLVHELGHNFGCHHRKDQTDSPGPGIFYYSAGWRWIGSDNVRYCSVMSYTDSWDGQPVSRVGYFSSPLIAHKGAATGDASDGDNARTLLDTKGVVSNYRAEVGGDYWLTIRVTEGGTTVPAPGSYSYSPGTVVQVTAHPNAHYTFSSWTGNASGTVNPVVIAMNENKSVTANFLRNIYAPANARGVKVLNRSLSQAEYINVLSWQANPDNEDIVNYRIYRVQGQQKTMLTYLEADVFEFRERGVEREGVYTYWIVAVNDEWREGDPAVVVVQ